MPDKLEERLAERLRSYESSVPADLEPGPRRRRRPVGWLVAGAGASAVAGIVLGVVLLQAEPPPVGNPTPTASASADTAVVPTATPTTPAASHTPGASASVPATASAIQTPPSTETPSASPSSAPAVGAITRWAPAGAFASDGWAEETTDVAYAAGHFIGIGYREPDDVRGHVGPSPAEPRVWISADGREWAGVDLGPAFDGAHLGSVVALPDGSAQIYGLIEPDNSGAEAAVWHSTDGVSWTSATLERPRNEIVADVEAGGRGYLTTIRTFEPDATEIWHSIDGIAWRSVHTIPFEDGDQHVHVTDVAAGPEGFVVTGYRSPLEGGDEGPKPFVMASGDGVTWYSAEASATPTSYFQHVAPVGGDWIIAASDLEPSATTWFSANGLAWEQRGTIDVPVPDHEWDPSSLIGGVTSTGDRVIASGAVTVCCHGPIWAAGVWSSPDGRSWERLGFPDGTYVVGAAEHDGVVVLAGFDRARPEDEFRARAMFWVGERD